MDQTLNYTPLSLKRLVNIASLNIDWKMALHLNLVGQRLTYSIESSSDNNRAFERSELLIKVASTRSTKLRFPLVHDRIFNEINRQHKGSSKRSGVEIEKKMTGSSIKRYHHSIIYSTYMFTC